MDKQNKKVISRFVIGVLILIVAAGIWAYRCFFAPSYNTSEEQKAKWVFVYPESSWNTVSDSLSARMEAPRSPLGIRILSTLYPERIPTPGAYLIEPKTSAVIVFHKISAGRQTPVRLTFTSRRLPEEMWGQISHHIMADSAKVAQTMTNRALLDSVGVSDSSFAYHLIPNTYEVYWTITPEDLVKKLEKEYQAFWTKEKEAKASSLGLSPYEVSILASIVEEESSKPDEYPLIAGLYLNRIARGIPLQADPTVKYALKDFGLKRILLGHLQVDSPYNTYKVKGLPPTPIRIPSPQAINGVLNAKKHNYIYMVAKADFSGYHDFSETLDEHSRKARLYQKALNEKGIR